MYPSEKDKQYFFEILSKYNNGSATEQEAAFVERLLAMMEYRRGEALAGFEEEKNSIRAAMEARLLQEIQHDTTELARPAVVHRVHFLRRYGRWAVAAIFILLLGGGAWLLSHRQDGYNNTLPPTAAAAAIDINPGKSGALLTLEDGRQVSLDSMENGVVALQGNAEVAMKNGQLVYTKAGGNHIVVGTAISYNTMTTPRGRQFQMRLPDGTQVWLNAGSSLKYPTTFTGKERRIEITGEAYFEVTKNAHMPFTVAVNDHTDVEVLGTHFNVNAYGDESSINTTLLEGSVKVHFNRQEQLLKPGQQSQVFSAASKVKLIPDADVNAAVAWKNGSFSFNNTSLTALMRQLSRWYDIDVEYKGAMPSDTFSGEIDRSLTLDQVLKGLTKTRIHYIIENNHKLIILP